MATTTEFQKPTFDARIQYYNLLSQVLQTGKQSAVLSDLRGWYRCLHITYNMVAPYVEKPDELRKELFKSRQMMLDLEKPFHGTETARFNRQLQVDKALMEFDEHLHMAAKRMMLPLADNNNGEFDPEEFARKSGMTQ